MADQGQSSKSNDAVVVDANGPSLRREDCPLWITVTAAEDQDKDASLPQLPPRYVRIPDRRLQVSSVQKYVAKKLGLPDESEVVIMCHGQPVPSTMQLREVAEMWFETSSVWRRLPTAVGSSGKNYCMVLSYCRKVQATT